MSVHDIIPRKDRDFDEFQKNVVALATANKVAWRIPDEDLDELTAPQAKWTAAWNIAKNKNLRNLTQVHAKIEARQKYEKVLRPFIQQWIQKNRKVRDDHRVAMGIRPFDTIKTDAPVPTLVPHISHRPLSAHRVKLLIGYLPQGAVNRISGKPEHCQRTELVYAFTKEEGRSAEFCPHETSSQTKSKTLIFEEAKAGSEVFLFSRFINTRNEPGPWSEAVKFRVP